MTSLDCRYPLLSPQIALEPDNFGKKDGAELIQHHPIIYSQWETLH
jgi:hypothetical protein